MLTNAKSLFTSEVFLNPTGVTVCAIPKPGLSSDSASVLTVTEPQLIVGVAVTAPVLNISMRVGTAGALQKCVPNLPVKFSV